MTLIQILRAAYDRIQKDPPKPRDNELLNEILKAIIVEELKGG